MGNEPNLEDMGLYDRIILKGREESTKELTISLIQNLPNLSDQQIAEVMKKPIEYVKNIRQQLKANTKNN